MPKSYAADIQPLFRSKDINCMGRMGVLLEEPDYMCDPAGNAAFADHAHARLVYARLTDPNRPMPPDGAWPQSQIDSYAAWMADGFHP
jgi:hypothetical protein